MSLGLAVATKGQLSDSHRLILYHSWALACMSPENARCYTFAHGFCCFNKKTAGTLQSLAIIVLLNSPRWVWVPMVLLWYTRVS